MIYNRLPPAIAQALAELPAGSSLLIDAGDLVIHLFRPEARELYRIERMWGPESPGAANATPGETSNARA